MTSDALSVAFRDDSITTASKATLQRMAKTLGFTQNQTVLYALARLRDELQKSEYALPRQTQTPNKAAPAQNDTQSSEPSPDYPELSVQQFEVIRQHAPKRRSKAVRSRSLTELL